MVRNVCVSPLPAVVLAAGLSTRMGEFKPLMMLGGETLIGHVLRSLWASEVVDRVVVVTGHQGAAVAAAVGGMSFSGMRVAVEMNPDYAAGEMLSSLRRGMSAVGAAPGFVLAFADQPAVGAGTIRALVGRFGATGAPLILPTYHGKRGHPVVLSWSLVPEIQALSPTDSLKTVVHRHLEAAESCAVEDASILEDLDTPEAFARARERWQTAGSTQSPLNGGLHV